MIEKLKEWLEATPKEEINRLFDSIKDTYKFPFNGDEFQKKLEYLQAEKEEHLTYVLVCHYVVNDFVKSSIVKVSGDSNRLLDGLDDYIEDNAPAPYFIHSRFIPTIKKEAFQGFNRIYTVSEYDSDFTFKNDMPLLPWEGYALYRYDGEKKTELHFEHKKEDLLAYIEKHDYVIDEYIQKGKVTHVWNRINRPKRTDNDLSQNNPQERAEEEADKSNIQEE